MKIYFKLAVVLLAVACISCSSDKEQEQDQMYIHGQITVADSVDASGDYSGIELLIPQRDSTGAISDTIFYARTDRAGTFSALARFKGKSFYPLYIGRGGEDIGRLNVILADGDTLDIQAQLPGIRETLSLKSDEHEAMEVFNRINRNFQRVLAMRNTGAISDSVMEQELNKWPDLFWEITERYENSLAASFAVEKNAQLLRGWQDEKMMQRIDAGLPADYVVGVAISYGKPYLSETKGIDAASAYLDSLISIAESERVKELVLRDKIEMYFDSSRIREAKQMLESYEDKHADNPASRRWANNIRYDLNYLAPGLQVPQFSFTNLSGDSVTTTSLQGSPYILEISPLANREYMNDYDRTIVIYEIYKNYGLKILTIPLDQSQVTVDAFFEERRKVWPVAKIGSFDVQNIIEKFNVTQVPTRFLVDENGVLVRKYVGGEFSEVIQGLNSILNNQNNDESLN